MRPNVIGFMKKLTLILSFLLLTTCGSDDTVNRCNFLLNVGVNTSLNLNLPEFSELMFTSTVRYIPNQGNAGIYVINVGNNMFRAFDAADPNHAPEPCSLLQLNGVDVTCGCGDENAYSLFTGQSIGDPLPCTLREYRTTLSGANLVISN